MAKGLFSARARSGVVVVAVLALTLTACGRRGALDRPAPVDPAAQTQSQTPSASGGAPSATQSDAPILLDALI